MMYKLQVLHVVMAILYLAFAYRLYRSGVWRLVPCLTIYSLFAGGLGFLWLPTDGDWYIYWTSASFVMGILALSVVYEWFNLFTRAISSSEAWPVGRAAVLATVPVVLGACKWKASGSLDAFVDMRQFFQLALFVFVCTVTAYWWIRPWSVPYAIKQHWVLLIPFLGALFISSATGANGLAWHLIPRTIDNYHILDAFCVTSKSACILAWIAMTLNYGPILAKN